MDLYNVRQITISFAIVMIIVICLAFYQDPLELVCNDLETISIKKMTINA